MSLWSVLYAIVIVSLIAHLAFGILWAPPPPSQPASLVLDSPPPPSIHRFEFR